MVNSRELINRIIIIIITNDPLLSFPCGSAGKESALNAGDLGSIPGLGRFPGEGQGYLLQYSGQENSTDYIVHGVSKSRTQLSDFHSLHIVNSKVDTGLE